MEKIKHNILKSAPWKHLEHPYFFCTLPFPTRKSTYICKKIFFNFNFAFSTYETK